MSGSRSTGLNGATYLCKFRINGNNIRCFKDINSKKQLFWAINPGTLAFLRRSTKWGSYAKIALLHLLKISIRFCRWHYIVQRATLSIKNKFLIHTQLNL